MASYVFIVPDLCHDMHGTAACPSTDNVKAGDTWLSAAMPPLIDYVNANGGVIFIVWDEESHVPFFAVGPTVKPGYASPASLTHRSLTKSVEEILGLPLLPTVSDATDFGDLSFLARSANSRRRRPAGLARRASGACPRRTAAAGAVLRRAARPTEDC